MTRNEARMVAEELIPLMRKEIKRIVEMVVEREEKKDDVFLDFIEASKLTSLSVRYLKEHINEIPHTVVGKKKLFSKASLIAYMNR